MQFTINTAKAARGQNTALQGILQERAPEALFILCQNLSKLLIFIHIRLILLLAAVVAHTQKERALRCIRLRTDLF